MKKWGKRIVLVCSATLIAVGILFFSFNLYVNWAYANHRHLIVKTVKPNPGTVYTHSDPGTTEFIEVLFGKKQFPDSTRLQYVKIRLTEDQFFEQLQKDRIFEGTKQQLLSQPEEVVECILREFDLRLRVNAKERAQGYGFVVKDIGYKKTALKLQKDFLGIEKDEFDEGGYQRFWEAMIVSGSPKIMVVDDAVPVNPKKFAFYRPWDNTILIEPASVSVNLTQEMAHARQFQLDPQRSARRFLWDSTMAFLETFWFDWEEYAIEYDRRYQYEDSFEYEAHQIYQPQIEKELSAEEATKTPDPVTCRCKR